MYRQALERAHEHARVERRLPAHQRSDVLRIVDVNPPPPPPKRRSAPMAVPEELRAPGAPVHRRDNIGRVLHVS